jgi:retron-type reverse transcriptase
MKRNECLKQKSNSRSTSSLLTSLRSNDKLMEEILSRENMIKALDKVVQNKGSAGVDGMEVYELKEYLKENWLNIKQAILEGTYKPLPIKR